MTRSSGLGGLTRGLLGLAAFVVVVAGMRAARELVVPLLGASFLAILCLPAVALLERRRVRPKLALTVVLTSVAMVGGLVITVVLRSLVQLGGELPAYKERIAGDLAALVTRLQDPSVPAWIREHASRDGLIGLLDPSGAFDLLSSLAGQVGALAANGVLILALVVLLLLEATAIRHRVGAGSDSPEDARGRYDLTLAEINRYMGLKSLISLGGAAIVSAWLALLGVDNALLWGLLAFLLNFVPNIGPLLAALPPVLLAYLQGGLGLAGHVALAFVVVHGVLVNVVETLALGDGMGLSNLVAFFSLVFWGWVLGPMGMLLSVPLTMALKIALEGTPEGRSWALWLGPAKRR